MDAPDGTWPQQSLIGRTKKMTRSLKTLFAILLLLAGLSANATTLTGSIKYPDGTGVTGRLLLSLSQDAALSTGGSCGGPAAISPTFQVQINLLNGAMVSPPPIFGNDCLSPQGTFYNVQVKDATGNLLWVDKWQINGATQDIGTIVPSNTAGTVSTAVLLLNPPFNADQAVAGNILPDVTAARSLGNNTTRWNAFLNNLTVANILSTPTFQGTPIFSGTTQFQASSAPAPIGGVGQIYYDNVCNCFLISNGGAFATLGTTTLGNNYQTVFSGGVAQVQRPSLGFPTGGCADNAGATRTDCLFGGIGNSGNVTFGNGTTTITWNLWSTDGSSATITAPTTVTANTSGSNIQITAPQGKGTGQGGQVQIQGGAADPTCASACNIGGKVIILGGNATAGQGAQGGGIQVTAGTGGANGGDITVTAGAGGTFGSGNSRGGDITVTAGAGSVATNRGGNINFVTGVGGGANGLKGALDLSFDAATTNQPAAALANHVRLYYDTNNATTMISENGAVYSKLQNSINSVTVRGSNFTTTSPGAPSNGYNVHWQHSGLSGVESISAYFATTDVDTTTWGTGSASSTTWTLAMANTGGGANFTILGGAATTQQGTNITIQGGTTGSGPSGGGNVTLLGGTGPSGGIGGTATVSSGSGGGNASSGATNITTPNGQGQGSSGSGNILVLTGSAIAGSNGTSGNITLNTGSTAGTGVPGNITIQPGASSSTNVQGGPLFLESGQGTGTAVPALVTIEGDNMGAASGTTSHSTINRVVINATKTGLASGSATSLVSVAFGTLPSAVGGTLIYSVEFSNGTDVCVASGNVHYTATDKSGTVQASTLTSERTLCTGTATLADSWAIPLASPAVLQITPTLTNLTSPTINRITYMLVSNTQGQATIQ